MKRLIGVMAVLLVPLCGFAADANQMKYVQLMYPQAATAATSGVVTVSAYKGNATFAAQWSPSAQASTGTVTLVHSATSGGTYTTVTNLAGTACVITQTGPITNEIQTVAIDLARVHPYVKVIASQAGDTNYVSAVLVAPMKSE